MHDQLRAQVRALHHATEMTHAILYLGITEATEAYEAVGLEPRAQGYVASRAAPMGRVGAATVEATFFNFSPAIIGMGVPSAWDVASPEDVVAARSEAMERFWARIDAPDKGRDDVTALLRAAADDLDLSGRPLAAANAAVEPPGTPWADWWQALTTVREFRGDGHVALLVGAELGPVDALVVNGAWQPNLSRRFLQKTRGWDDDAFAAAEARLAERGWWDDGDLTDDGRAARDELEAETDRLAAAPWATLTAEQRETVFAFGCRLIEAMNAAEVLRRPIPVLDWPA